MMNSEAENKVKSSGLLYGDYLQLDKVLSSQELQSQKISKKSVHDEHLFIITHQAFELWFKQILYEIDSIREIFACQVVGETSMLEIVRRTRRVSLILKLLVEQIILLETMTPQDFMDFRDYLAPGSGFQSKQFRLIEIKLGLKQDDRVAYNIQHYLEVFEGQPKCLNELKSAEKHRSLCDLVQQWLSRTPGLEEDGFNFWEKFRISVEKILADEENNIMKTTDEDQKNTLQIEHQKRKEMYESILDINIHEKLRQRGIRKFSHRAMQGAMLISIYRHEPLFAQPFEFLSILMDIDSYITKWRYNHIMLVQRMLGSQLMGTGGSSGYQYLKTTLNDRYKVFLDLFNLSSFLLPRDAVPVLTDEMKQRLRVGFQ